MGTSQIWSVSRIDTWLSIFLIYINDLPDNLDFNCKTFSDDSSIFYKVFDKHISRATLNKDLELINK